MRRRFAVLILLPLLALAAAPVSAAAPFPNRIDLPDGWAPEGITAGHGSTVYVGSLASGSIWQADVRTGAGSVLAVGVGEPAVGLEFERRSNRIWVAGAGGNVRVYDASSGALLATYPFATAGFLNDLVVTRDAVYVTDSLVPQLGVIPLGPGGALPAPGAATARPLGGDIAYVPNQFNANGIVERNGWLIIVNTFTGQLFRVDPATGAGTEIALVGGGATFGDGLELRGSRLYVVRNFLDTVSVFRLGPGLGSATQLGDLTSPELSTPATAALQAGQLWAANARFAVPGATEFWLTRLPANP